MPTLRRAPGLLMLVLFATANSSCSLCLSTERQLAQWHVALPCEATAAIIAGALRIELQAESIALATGAPVTPIPPSHRAPTGGGFVIEFTGNAHGEWLPVASHRLVQRIPRGTASIEPIALPTTQLPGFGANTHHRITVTITPLRDGTALRLAAEPTRFARLAALLERTLLLAHSLDGGGPGLAEANLAAWRLHRLLSAARATRDGQQQRKWLRRAARQPDAPSSMFVELAHLATSDGQHRQAQTYLRRAMLIEPNALLRAKIARRIAQRDEQPSDLRGHAIGLLLTGDTAAAEHVLHSARRQNAQPAVDYQLLSHVHRHRGDEMATVAAQLLAREYAETPPATTPQHASLRTSWRHTLSSGPLRVRASTTRPVTATPPR